MKYLAAVTLVLAFVATPFALGENEAKEAPVVSDLKKDAERRLKRVVGNKRTRDIMNNLNRLMGRRRGGWGR